MFLKHHSKSRKFYLAAKHGEIRTVTAMLAGLMVDDLNDQRSSHSRRSALIVASGRGHSAIVKTILTRSDVDVNLHDSKGYTALMRAARHGPADIVKALLSRPDIDIRTVSMSGKTALDLAVNKDIKKLLEDAEVKLEEELTKTARPLPSVPAAEDALSPSSGVPSVSLTVDELSMGSDDDIDDNSTTMSDLPYSMSFVGDFRASMRYIADHLDQAGVFKDEDDLYLYEPEAESKPVPDSDELVPAAVEPVSDVAEPASTTAAIESAILAKVAVRKGSLFDPRVESITDERILQLQAQHDLIAEQCRHYAERRAWVYVLNDLQQHHRRARFAKSSKQNIITKLGKEIEALEENSSSLALSVQDYETLPARRQKLIVELEELVNQLRHDKNIVSMSHAAYLLNSMRDTNFGNAK